MAARQDEPGIIPGSMGARSYIAELNLAHFGIRFAVDLGAESTLSGGLNLREEAGHLEHVYQPQCQLHRADAEEPDRDED